MTLTPSSDAVSTTARSSSRVSSGAAVDDPAPGEAGRREHGRLRGDHLDHVGAVADDPAGRGHEGRRIVRLQAELVAVTAGDADRRGRRQDARTGHVAGVDRVAQGDLEVPERARAACGRHAGAERRGRVTGGGQHDLGVRAPEDGPDRALGRIERVVRVGVDQPGQEGPAGAVDAGGRRRRRSRRRASVRAGSCGSIALIRSPSTSHVDVLAGGLGQAVDDADVARSRCASVTG